MKSELSLTSTTTILTKMSASLFLLGFAAPESISAKLGISRLQVAVEAAFPFAVVTLASEGLLCLSRLHIIPLYAANFTLAAFSLLSFGVFAYLDHTLNEMIKVFIVVMGVMFCLLQLTHGYSMLKSIR